MDVRLTDSDLDRLDPRTRELVLRAARAGAKARGEVVREEKPPEDGFRVVSRETALDKEAKRREQYGRYGRRSPIRLH